MSRDFSEIMLDQTDKDLVRILTFEKDQFQPAAILAAEVELKKRNLTVDRFDLISAELEMEAKRIKEMAEQPLGTTWKFMAFVLPGIITLAFSGSFKSEGYERKAKELLRWTLYGFGFYTILVMLAILI